MKEWAKIPTNWILNKQNPGLHGFSWQGPDRANYIAALMIYIALAHHANREPTRELTEIGSVKLSYTELAMITGLSRAKISGAIRVLTDKKLIKKIKDNKTNIYIMSSYNKTGGWNWAKLPMKHLYGNNGEYIKPFNEFRLRLKNELNSLKLYLLLVALRNNNINHATPSYDTIYFYTKISKNDIRSAISLLVNLGLIQVQALPISDKYEKIKNFYRIMGIEARRHTGNISNDKLIRSIEI